MKKDLTLQDFMYPFDESLIAHRPLEERDTSRLLCRTKDGTLHDRNFQELPDLLPENTLLIVNNTKVMPSRILGETDTGGKAELLLLAPHPNKASAWYVLGKPSRKFAPGFTIRFQDGVEATILSAAESAEAPGPYIAQFNRDESSFRDWLANYGYMPLPPYISRVNPKAGLESEDRVRYQTVYAHEEGSAAAPTAGLHFTPRVMESLANRGIIVAPVTLHVGSGTFLPVKTEDIKAHTMHEERFLIPRATLKAIEEAREKDRTIVVVGTTSLRCLESFVRMYPAPEARRQACDQWLSTRLFIYPRHPDDRHQTWAADAMITNFHQPGSTLFMLVAALLGLTEVKEAYAHAVRERYRFFSYGDSCLFWLR